MAAAILLAGCADDDPPEVGTVAQTGAADPSGAVDCLGNPAADPTTFPPAPADDIARPDDRIVDRRGEDRVEIAIRDNVYEPRWVRVDPCTEVIFTNRGANTHNVLPAADGAFPAIDTEALLDGPQALVLAAPGDYPFYCSIHGTATLGQTGYLVVGDG
jgi:plastocyanin